jgi:drug/metabolite transporter (DMT)-like permease
VGFGVAGLILIWGTTFAAIRIGLETVPPFAGIALRFTIAAGVLFVGARVVGSDWRVGGNQWGLWTLNALCHFVVPYGVVYWSEQWLPSGLVALLFSTNPLFVALLAHLLLPGERLGRLGWLGVMAGFAGVATIYSEDLSALAGDRAQWVAVVFLVAPLVAAIGDVLVKRYWSQVHAVSLTAPSLAMTAVVMAGLSLAFEDPASIELSAKAWAVILYLALFGTALAFTVYFRLLSRVRVTGLTLIAYPIPVVALLIGALGMGEVITWRVAFGGGLILAGVWAALRMPQSGLKICRIAAIIGGRRIPVSNQPPKGLSAHERRYPPTDHRATLAPGGRGFARDSVAKSQLPAGALLGAVPPRSDAPVSAGRRGSSGVSRVL